MRIFKSRYFDKFARKAKISDKTLQNAITEIENGLIDADLGSGVYKQRLPKQGRGKSKGFRSIILYKTAQFSLFVYGFDKKDQQNISAEDEMKFKALANVVLNFSPVQIQSAVDNQEFIEIHYDKETSL
ncbi:type II toxin-antitoxin system RelE/ParE family toxin [Actinobacillus porcinus]|uniref:type II toxin-antitoxin system RelE/ParE family toxin n=1 Tax=Actinobacillus porcinus TaxID=51048 RepID=UPI0023538DF5|nr:type II toxin-antitoxin system RelE/ParE family toxin [Actinobacillus porcinus]MCI5764756.1 type II toxin-antitoxin system RelE/ParE family toxin [Actinobacillus porcinus]MDD7544469.1 type II toxin-antitoxin system RelE/ParE family toxin [Actinobacillus porcinus]MDY5421669.1 type II toxin-antitoxin system RelE/ParE family toxin [Actinobacillus porcinus]MDY5848029.1 type II toxin-antitoxin system RelE/ParE family toxin [Actinobacillus porcinus]